MDPLVPLESVETRESLARGALQVSRMGQDDSGSSVVSYRRADADQTKPQRPPKGIWLSLNQ